MCGGKPDTPKPQPNYALMRESEAAREMQARAKHEMKKTRLEDRIGRMGNRFGRASLFTGSQGGAGYTGRSMFDGIA